MNALHVWFPGEGKPCQANSQSTDFNTLAIF
jgi:hypothetical protein